MIKADKQNLSMNQMPLQTDHRLNTITNMMSMADGSAMCTIALAGVIRYMFTPSPRMVRKLLRRWKRQGHITHKLSVSSFGDIHEDLGIPLIYKGYFNAHHPMEEGDYAYAYFSSPTERIKMVVLMNHHKEIIYDPMGSSSLVRGGRLAGLRIFQYPGTPGKE